MPAGGVGCPPLPCLGRLFTHVRRGKLSANKVRAKEPRLRKHGVGENKIDTKIYSCIGRKEYNEQIELVGECGVRRIHNGR